MGHNSYKNKQRLNITLPIGLKDQVLEALRKNYHEVNLSKLVTELLQNWLREQAIQPKTYDRDSIVKKYLKKNLNHIDNE